MAQNAYIHPATHLVPEDLGYFDVFFPAYGSRFRLKANFDISGYSNDSQVLLTALKKYGLMFADQGTTASATGASDAGFQTLLLEINYNKQIPFNNDYFEMVQSPYPIVRGFTPATLTCGNRSQNAAPYVPTWKPNCSPLSVSATVDYMRASNSAVAGPFWVVIVVLCTLQLFVLSDK